MNKQKSAKKWTDAIQTVFVDCPSSPCKRCFEVKCLGEIGEVAPEVADFAMREESFADVVYILERSVFNVKDTVHNELVERGSVYLSPRFDLVYPAGHLWTKGSGARCCGCVFMERVRCVIEDVVCSITKKSSLSWLPSPSFYCFVVNARSLRSTYVVLHFRTLVANSIT
jgi:hypothetical protein